jgi:hypothetical protein
MAAKAARDTGHQVVIFSRRIKSPLYGAQYLHRPIPGVTNQDDFIEVSYELRGEPEEYRRKVYGQRWDGKVSPEDLLEQHEAWDIRETYDRLWTMFTDKIVDVEIDGASIQSLIDSQEHGLIVNTIPLPALCTKQHQFLSTDVVAAGDAPELGIKISDMYRCPQDSVICNGKPEPFWYRMSNIFGHTTVEWPLVDQTKVPIPSASLVKKPTEHRCSCWPDLLKVGRYGSWTKGVLSHDAYFTVAERLGNGAAA